MQKLKHEEIPRHSPEKIRDLPKYPITVVLDNIRSIHNVGSIFRTSDAFQIEKLILTGITGTPIHRGLHKTALGAQDTVAWMYVQDAQAVIPMLRESGYTIAALEITDEPTLIHEVKLEHFPLCLIIGNELHGVDESLISLVDLALEIPQYGAKQSLNVSVACGVALHDLVSRYRQLSNGQIET